VLPDEIEGVITAGGGRDGPLRWRGIHVHAGSQMRTLDAWRDAFHVALEVRQDLSSQLPDFDTVDAGGGFPVLDPPDCLAPGAFAAAASGELRRQDGARRVWPSSPDGPWWHVVAGWSARSCMFGPAAQGRSS
jgi:hypothetical protein